jgi:hypothetical protein
VGEYLIQTLMRPKHKNDLFQFLQKSKFGITRFEFFDSEEQTAIQFNKTPFRFVIKTSPRSFDHFEIVYVQYAPDLPYSDWIPSSTEGYMNFEELKNYLWT